jgi:hypothetical protein
MLSITPKRSLEIFEYSICTACKDVLGLSEAVQDILGSGLRFTKLLQDLRSNSIKLYDLCRLLRYAAVDSVFAPGTGDKEVCLAGAFWRRSISFCLRVTASSNGLIYKVVTVELSVGGAGLEYYFGQSQ